MTDLEQRLFDVEDCIREIAKRMGGTALDLLNSESFGRVWNHPERTNAPVIELSGEITTDGHTASYTVRNIESPQPIGQDRNGTLLYEGDTVAYITLDDECCVFPGRYDDEVLLTHKDGAHEFNTHASRLLLLNCGPNNPNRKEDERK